MLGLGSALHDLKSFAQASLEPGRHAELFSGLLVPRQATFARLIVSAPWMNPRTRASAACRLSQAM